MDDRVIRRALRRAGAEGPPRLELLGEIPADPGTVGILPGSFDPLTTGHAALAGALREHGCDLVLLVYSPRTMPKEGRVERPLLPPERRIASMLEWAQTNDGAAVAVCSHGLYVDQATATAAAFPGSEIVIGLGSDKVRQLFDASWYRDPDAALTRLFRVARVAYATRGSDRERVRELLDRAGRWRARLAPLVLPPGVGAVSSGEVRRRLRRGADVSALVPEEVRPYLAPSG